MLFGPDICRVLEQAQTREWLDTNGLGGFASGTIAGLHTRRYHGLLIAALRPPGGRFLLLSKFEETLTLSGRAYPLSANRYPGVIHPEGFTYLTEFRLDGMPVWTFEVEGCVVEKRVFLLQNENTVAVEYSFSGGMLGVSFEVRPLVAFREFHHLSHANGEARTDVEVGPGVATVQLYKDLPALHFRYDEGATIDTRGEWYYNFVYERETERGLDNREDLYQPFTLKYDLRDQNRIVLIASTERRTRDEFGGLRDLELSRRQAKPASSEPIVAALSAAAGHYLARRGSGQTVMAGYHWFGDWSRDTMIALPGLTLATGRHDSARNILGAFAACVDQGMLPNWFPGDGTTPEYNTADATLWFFEAVRSYLHYTGDRPFVLDVLYPVLAGIVEWHLRGTRFGIKVDVDGLLQAGEAGVQLTWMDAKVGDQVITPRTGKAVELQALWHNALCVMRDLAGLRGDHSGAAEYGCRAERVRRHFLPAFWNEAGGCLHDVVTTDGPDSSFRPNQILAVSLFHPLVTDTLAGQIVEAVYRELWTPRGLRTLSPRDSRYAPRYVGGPVERDRVYHQGTVWPWLMGPFVSAYLRVHQHSADARQTAAIWLRDFLPHLGEAGLGHVSEIFDGDAPHAARGAIAQAWSVAELLRCAVEDVFRGPETKPNKETY